MSPMSNHPLKKWLVLGAGVVLQAVLGGIYAWSAFVPPLYEQAGLSKGQCGSIFGLAIATFAIAMIPAGKFLQRFGPRLTAAIGSILFGVGYLLASYSNGSFVGLLLSYGLVVGVGIGFGYVCPLTTGMKWFPDNKGLVTGVAVAGFGGGAIILSSVAEHLLAGKFKVFAALGAQFNPIFDQIRFFSAHLKVFDISGNGFTPDYLAVADAIVIDDHQVFLVVKIEDLNLIHRISENDAAAP